MQFYNLQLTVLVQNPEPAADFDTVANEKKQHEVNVGKIKTQSNFEK